jgi:hypothetical protein
MEISFDHVIQVMVFMEKNHNYILHGFNNLYEK